MVKIMIRLELGKYKVTELMDMKKLKLLTKEEVAAELHTRGVDDYKIIKLMRAG